MEILSILFSLMPFFAVVALVIFLIVKSRRDKPSNETGHSKSYNDGFRDGYQSLSKKIRDELANNLNVTRERLLEIVGAVSPESTIKKAPEAVTKKPTPVKQPKVEQKTKEQIQLRNYNILLYMGSFLIIAAAATFIGATVPILARLAGLGIITALFYFVGMILYKKLPHLKPAATAFIGTSLAIIPFNGLALNILGNLSVEISWLIISALVCLRCIICWHGFKQKAYGMKFLPEFLHMLQY